ncbi:MAG: translation initiation factor IF-2 [Candidatus Saccharimonadales bacterium]
MADSEQTTKQIQIPSELTVKEFAERINVSVTDTVAEFMKNGVMATINDVIDFDTAEIVADDLGVVITPEKKESKEEEQRIKLAPGEGETRPPIVAVMGHVDHGKTTLLDAIRTTNVAEHEAGGITQHIGAYQITHKDRAITFLDTPGHEAFSILREHGARITDVAVIVVAADDGLKPQTEEAIKFAKEAGVQIVVAINKVDKPEADPNRTKQQLSELELIPEEWGGDTVMVEVSAKTGQNIEKLLDMILLVVDIVDLRARFDGNAEGTVVESHMATGLGPVTTLLVEHGQLKAGDYLVGGGAWGKVRTLKDTTGQPIKSAGPATPTVVSGWKEIPIFGERFFVVDNEKEARAKSVKSKRRHSQEVTASVKKVTEQEEILSAIAEGATNHVPVIVKADVQGSLESVVQSINELGNAEVKAKVVASGVGDIAESDVSLAESAGSTIVGFNVGMSGSVKRLADRSGINVKTYKVIYELLDDLKAQLSGELKPETVEEVVGTLQVKGVFKVSKNSLICGGLVKKGKLTPGLLVRKLQKGEEAEAKRLGTVKSLQREKDNVPEVTTGTMCGLSVDTIEKADIAEGDMLEFFTQETKERSL